MSLFHRDIKSENVLVFSCDSDKQNIQVKLCDFGISKRLEKKNEDGNSQQRKASSPPSTMVQNEEGGIALN
jgi:serine/threonine protein kinase